MGGGRELHHCSKPASSPVLHVLVGSWHLCSIPISCQPQGCQTIPWEPKARQPGKLPGFPPNSCPQPPRAGTLPRSTGLWCVPCLCPCHGLCPGRQVTSQSPQRSHSPPIPPHFLPSLQTYSKEKCEAMENQACPCQPGHIPPPQLPDSQTTGCPAAGSSVPHPSWFPTPPVQDPEHLKSVLECTEEHCTTDFCGAARASRVKVLLVKDQWFPHSPFPVLLQTQVLHQLQPS